MDDALADERTATRATLDAQWQNSRRLLDWMHVPGMADYVNKLVSGKSLADGGHWAIYARNQHLLPLSNRLGRPLTMITLGSGDSHIEAALIRDFGWPIDKIVCLEYDAKLREAAVGNLSGLDLEIDMAFLDFNDPPATLPPADIVFCCHAIHHADRIEQFLTFVNGLLREDSLFLGIEYFGPTRFQVEHDVRDLIRDLDAMLPPELKYDLRLSEPVSAPIRFATIKEVREADISESVRSSDLRTLLLANFPIVDLKPMGGTILRWLFQYRAGDFLPENADHLAIARLLIHIEKTTIESGRIRSDDLFFVCRRSDTV